MSPQKDSPLKDHHLMPVFVQDGNLRGKTLVHTSAHGMFGSDLLTDNARFDLEEQGISISHSKLALDLCAAGLESDAEIELSSCYGADSVRPSSVDVRQSGVREELAKSAQGIGGRAPFARSLASSLAALGYNNINIVAHHGSIASNSSTTLNRSDGHDPNSTIVNAVTTEENFRTSDVSAGEKSKALAKLLQQHIEDRNLGNYVKIIEDNKYAMTMEDAESVKKSPGGEVQEFFRSLDDEIRRINDMNQRMAEAIQSGNPNDINAIKNNGAVVHEHMINCAICAMSDRDVFDALLNDQSGKRSNIVPNEDMLITAICASKPKAVGAMLSHGANPNHVIESSGESLLSRAVRESSAGVVQALVDGRADINIRNTYGGTPLTVAAAYGKTDAISILLENRADVHAKDMEGKTALELARARQVHAPGSAMVLAIDELVNAEKNVFPDLPAQRRGALPPLVNPAQQQRGERSHSEAPPNQGLHPSAAGQSAPRHVMPVVSSRDRHRS